MHVQLLPRVRGQAPYSGGVPEDGVVRERGQRAPKQVRHRVRLHAQHRVLRPARLAQEAVRRAGFPHNGPETGQQQSQVRHCMFTLFPSFPTTSLNPPPARHISWSREINRTVFHVVK